MKKLFGALLLTCFLAGPSLATTYTTYYHLEKMIKSTGNWHTTINSNMDAIDNEMHSIVTAYTALVASESATRGTQDSYLHQQILLKYGDLVARLGSLPEVYVLSSTFNGPTGVELALPKSVDSVSDYAVAVEPTTRTGAIGDVYVTQATDKATVAGYIDTEVAAIKAKTDLIPASPAAVGSAMTLADDAITASKFDESTAFPLKSADTGATAVARTGADADTLETLSDQLDGVNVTKWCGETLTTPGDAGWNGN